MAGEGKLVYKTNNGGLAYKKSGSDVGKLVFKIRSPGQTLITFAWDESGKDLDIVGYWTGAESMKVGYGWNTSTSELVTPPYHILYSGDITAQNASEWCKIWMKPWYQGERTFKVHFNFYGFDSYYPGSTCTVIATQPNGKTLIKQNQQCSTGRHRKAELFDPYCLVTFNSKGELDSLT